MAAYKHVLEEVSASPSSVTSLRERAEAAAARVKDAAHQIAAALAPPVDAAKVDAFGAGSPRTGRDAPGVRDSLCRPGGLGVAYGARIAVPGVLSCWVWPLVRNVASATSSLRRPR